MDRELLFNLETIIIFNEVKTSLKDISKDLKSILTNMENKSLKLINSKSETKENSAGKERGNIQHFMQQPGVMGFDDIAGLKDQKQMLFTLIILPKLQPQLFGDRIVGNSILLYGPPGTGKTKLAHAIAAESGAQFYTLSLSDILSSLVGETEKNIHQIFTQMKSSNSNSVLFIDEIDSICRKRDSREHEYSRRIKTEIMNQMSNIEKSSNIIVIAATNCPWDLDTAILRRFKKQLHIPLPNSEERMELFTMFTHNFSISFSPKNCTTLIELCEGLSGSDISNLVQDALNMPLNELHGTKIWKKTFDGFYEPYYCDPFLGEQQPINIDDICFSELKDLPPKSVKARPVTIDDILNAVKEVHVTVSQTDVRKYEEFQTSFSNFN